VNEYNIDTCFHLAAQTIVDVAKKFPLSTFESNIKGTWNILEASRNCKTIKRLIIASSDKAYGTHSKLPYKESYPLHGEYPYEVSKTCCDLLAQCYFKTYNLPIAIARCANIFGGGDFNFSRIVPGTIRSLIFDENPVIRSDGTPLRDYLYVEDAVDAYLTLAENLDKNIIKGEAFNFGSGKPISVVDLVNLIIKISGKNYLKPKILNKAIAEIRDQYLSCEKAKKLLKWEAKFNLEDALIRTYEWYEKFFREK